MDLRPAYMLSGDESVATLDALHAEIALLQTYRLEVMARLHETGHAKDLSGQDTARFLATRHRLNHPQVQRDLRLATTLPKYPAVRAALPDPHAPIGDDPTIQYRDVTADQAPATNSTDAADGADGADRVLPVLLHPDQGEAIVSSLEAVPAAAMVPVEHLAAAEDRMVEAARHLAPWELKKLGRQVRDILDTDGPEPAEEAAERREALRLTNAPHGVRFSGYLANEHAELFRTAIEAAAKPRMVDGERDPRSRDKRQADGLKTVVGLATATGELPAHGGVRPHVTVTIDLAELQAMGRAATGDLQFGDNLSAAKVRELACDAGIIPVVLGSESQPLDVGREERYVTKSIRRALIARDKGCVVCGAPPRYCHAHHVVHWADGGPTTLNNLTLVCSHDHTAVHAGHYTITITNNKAHITRPTWATPPRPTQPPRTAPPQPANRAGTDRPDPTNRAETEGPDPTNGAGPEGPDATSRAGTGGADSTSRAGSEGFDPTSRAASEGPDPTNGAGTDGPDPTTPAGQAELRDPGQPSSAADPPRSTRVAPPRADGTASTGTDNDPFWGQDPPTGHAIDVGPDGVGPDDPAALRPIRAFPLVGDPPALAATRPADFDPWGPEVLDTG